MLKRTYNGESPINVPSIRLTRGLPTTLATSANSKFAENFRLQQEERAVMVKSRDLCVALSDPRAESREQVETATSKKDYTNTLSGDEILQLRGRQITALNTHARRVH